MVLLYNRIRIPHINTTKDNPLLLHDDITFFTCMGLVSKMQILILLVGNHLFSTSSNMNEHYTGWTTLR